MSTQNNPGFITQQSTMPPVSLVKTEPQTVIKNEPRDYEIEEIGMEDTFMPLDDIKDIDIISHIIHDDLIKIETVSEDNILESQHSESVETHVIIKAENAPFVKIENITPNESLNKTNENASNGNLSKGAGQEVVKVQGSIEDFDALDNLSQKFVECYKTYKNTLWEKEKEKVKVIKAPTIPVEPHEYTSVAKDKHVCNQCQKLFIKLDYVKFHIKQMHREVTTMYQCPYCPYKSKWGLQYHVIQIHKDIIKDMRKFEYQCNKCNYKTYSHKVLKRHKLTHLKPEEIQHYYCYHCSYKTMRKYHIISHVSRHLKNKQIKRGKRYHCDKCDYYTYRNPNLNSHKLIHLKPEEIQYFYCYHCSYKSKKKETLKAHIFRHFKNRDVPFYCYICDFMTPRRDLIIEHFKKHSKHCSKYDETEYKYLLETFNGKHEKRYLCDKCEYKTHTHSLLKRHKLRHANPEALQYFYCYHCSQKCKKKYSLQTHIFRHFKKGEVPFHCYICDFMTLKRDLIIEHLRKHSKHHSQYDEGKYKYLLETRTKKPELRYRCDVCGYKTYKLNRHKLIHLKPEEIQYFHCYHCSYKSKRKDILTCHISRHFKNEEVTFHCYICDFMTPKRDLIAKHIQKHSSVQIKSEIKEES